MIFNLTIGYGRKTFATHKRVEVDISRNGTAMAFHGQRVVATMDRARLVTMAAEVLVIDGHESAGVDRQGNVKTVYREWYLLQVEEVKKGGAA